MILGSFDRSAVSLIIVTFKIMFKITPLNRNILHTFFKIYFIHIECP